MRDITPIRIISIHALHEESDRTPITNAQIEAISIHALHEESDAYLRHGDKPPIISIHALHEESDPTYSQALRQHVHFNPRSP